MGYEIKHPDVTLMKEVIREFAWNINATISLKQLRDKGSQLDAFSP